MMISLRGGAHQLCDGWRRREFMAFGSLAALAACGGATSAAGSPLSTARSSGRAAAGFGSARRCIFLFLTGGPPQHDTWDPKPDAPAEIRGELAPIATNVAGIQVSELFPKLAANVSKFRVVRSLYNYDTVHTTAGY